jgi:hypothetical protein
MAWENAVEDYIVNSSVPAEKAGNAVVYAAAFVRNSFNMIENTPRLSAVDIALRIKTIGSYLEELSTIRNVLNHFGFEDVNVANSTNAALVSLSAALVDAQSTLKGAWTQRAEAEAGF